MQQQQQQQSIPMFANTDSKIAYQKAGEGGLTRGKVIHVPGAIQDTDFEGDVVFACVDGIRPDYDRPIAKLTRSKNENGTASIQKDFYDNYENAYAEWQGLVEKFRSPREAYRQLKTSPSIASIVNTQTINETRSLGIVDGVLGLQERDFYAKLATTSFAANNLIFTVDRYNEGTAQAKVGEMQPPDLISHGETRVTKTLYKNIGHIAESEEARLMALHDTMGLRQEKTIKDMARLLNSQISTELETAPSLAGSDWGAVSGTPPDSANNPTANIDAAVTIIEGHGFNTDYMAAHNRVVNDLMSNKFIVGRANIGNDAKYSSNIIDYSNLPTIIKDQGFTSTIAVIGNKEATWLAEGPTVVAAYDEDVVGYRGWLIKQWRLPYIVEPEAIRKITGVSA